MNFFRRLFTGCLSHAYLRERGAKGSYWLVCDHCGDRQQMLPKQKLKVKKAGRLFKIAERKRA
jgi:hypothetical protein